MCVNVFFVNAPAVHLLGPLVFRVVSRRFAPILGREFGPRGRPPPSYSHKVCAMLVLELVCFNALSCMCFCWSVLLQHLWWNMSLIGPDVFAVCVGMIAGGLAEGVGWGTFVSASFVRQACVCKFCLASFCVQVLFGKFVCVQVLLGKCMFASALQLCMHGYKVFLY